MLPGNAKCSMTSLADTKHIFREIKIYLFMKPRISQLAKTHPRRLRPGAVSEVDKMFVVKVFCKIETSPWALTLIEPVPAVTRARKSSEASEGRGEAGKEAGKEGGTWDLGVNLRV